MVWYGTCGRSGAVPAASISVCLSLCLFVCRIASYSAFMHPSVSLVVFSFVPSSTRFVRPIRDPVDGASCQ